jgi:uncharacterized protein (TIGR02996 family)
MIKRGYFEIVEGWVEGVGCAPARIPLQAHLELGREFPRASSDWSALSRMRDVAVPAGVTTNYSAVGSGYARVWRSVEGFRIVAVGYQNVVTLNGEAVQETTLQQGDLLTWGDVTLRFVEVDEPENREPRLEAAIASAPDEESCWQVYADWLLERGDPLGERIRGLGPDDAAVLGNLLPLVAEYGALTLEWSHGFIRAALLRSWGSVQADELLVWLLALPVSRFIRSIDVELRSFIVRERGPAGLQTVLEQIQRVLHDAPLPSLEHLTLGPLFVPVDAVLTNVVRLQKAPRLLQQNFLSMKTTAWLEIERGLELGQRRELLVGASVQLQETPRVLVGSVYWRAELGEDGWSLFSASPDDRTKRLKLNGREPSSNWHPLRDGDLITSGDWLSLRFRCA